MDVSVDDLQCRMEKYMEVLKAAEEEQNTSKVRRYTRIVKQYKDAIKLCQSGKTIPLEELPNPPGFEPLAKNLLVVPNAGVTPGASPRSSPKPSPRPSPQPIRKAPPIPPKPDSIPEVLVPIIVEEKHVSLNDDNLEEELGSRLEVYRSVSESAGAEGNTSKTRRYNRIIKQYEDAIALYKSGKPVALEELPNPPGFPPLVPVKSAPPSPVPERAEIAEEAVPVPVVTRADKQTSLLMERQLEYKNAAIAAKKAGQLGEAKEFLKIFKAFDRLIQASQCGLPVDLTTIPVSLKAKADIEQSFHMVTKTDLKDGSESEVYETILKELTDQIKMCMNTRNSFKINGDLANANKFEQFALNFKKDLNHVKGCLSSSYPVPKFHYETKAFSIIKCNSDLKDNDLELTIIQGLGYKVSNPDDVDTYLTYEFPYPSESPPTGKTSTIKNTNNPVYNSKHMFVINREARSCQRIFKRGGIKLEIWSKAGFFHSDTSLGQVLVKLTSLATENTVHEVLDVMNGRRPAGGKLEVKLRIRDPIFSKKVDNVSEKWLIIDYK